MADNELSIRISVAAADAIAALETLQKRIGTVSAAAGAMASPKLDLTVTANLAAVDALQGRLDGLAGKEVPVAVSADGAAVDALQGRLDGLAGKEVPVAVSADGAAVDALQSRLDGLAGKEVPVAVSADGAAVDALQGRLDGLAGKEVPVAVSADGAAVDALQSRLDGLAGKEVPVAVSADGAAVDALQGRLDGLAGKEVPVAVSADGAAVDALQSRLDGLAGKEVPVAVSADGAAVDALQGRLDGLAGKEVPVAVSADGAAVDALQSRLDGLAGKEVPVAVSADGAAVDALQSRLDGLAGKEVPVAVSADGAAVDALQGRLDGLAGKEVPVAVSADGAAVDAIQSRLDGLAGKEVPVAVSADGAAVDALQGRLDGLAGKEVPVAVSADGAAVDALQGRLDGLAGKEVPVAVSADGAAVDAIQSRLDGLAGKEVPVAVSADGAAVDALQGRLDGLAGKEVPVAVSADGAAVDALQGRLDGLAGKEVPVAVSADGAAVDALQGRLDDLDGQEVSVEVSSSGLEEIPGAAKRAESGLSALRAAATKTAVAIGSLSSQVGSLVAKGASWGYDKIKTGFLAISAAVAAGTAAIVHFGIQQEQSRQRMQVMLGSVEQGNTLFKQLQGFANVTPFNTSEVVKAGQTLLTFGVAASEVGDQLKMVGDASAATGKPLNDLATIYGQVMARGKADTERLNQLTEAGIPIVRMLADAYGTSAQGVYELAEKGKITAAEVQAAFQVMTSSGGVFAGMMEQQSRTVGGLWSTLVGKIQTAAGTLGEQLAPIMSFVLDKAIEMVDVIGAMVDDGRMVRMFADWGRVGVAFFAELTKRCHDFYTFTIAAFQTIGAAVEMIWSGIKTGFLGIVTGVVAVIETAINNFLKAYNVAAGVLGKQKISVDWTWTKAMAETTADSARDTRDAYRRWTDGGYFGQAMVDNEAFALDVDAWADRVDGAIEQGAEKIQQAIAGNREEELAVSVRSDAAGASRAAGDAGRAPELRIVDSLTKIGMYNFGAAALNSLDVERNSLLREIAAQVGLRPTIVRV